MRAFLIPFQCRLALAPWWLSLVALLSATPAWPAAGTAGQTAEWTLSTDGAHILQRSTQLVWPRCVEGMRWNGRFCIGEPLWLDQSEAQALARQRAQATGLAWRLPYIRELQQFARMSAAAPDASRPSVPEATQGWVWSGTTPIQIHEINPYRYDNVMKGGNGQSTSQMKFLHGWVVNTATGEARDDVLKRTKMFVRLVRRLEEH
jgi:hypothetical protein